MKPLTLSINLSYFCNFRCKFCYLTNKQLSDKTIISHERLDSLLSQIKDIKYIDLYGGEIGLLDEKTFYSYKNIIRKHYDGEINLVTNLSMLRDYFFDDDISLSVSYDFDAREKSDIVYRNMIMSKKPIHLLILASEQVLKMDIDYMIKVINFCSSIKSVEIKPYSINQANSQQVTHAQFEDFIINWSDRIKDMNFQFVNYDKIDKAFFLENNSFSDDHVYITPNGKFAVLEFDKQDKEYFLELDSIDKYYEWANSEKTNLSPICKSCKYVGHCLTEHHRYVKDLDNSCNGYIGLLNWYETLES